LAVSRRVSKILADKKQYYIVSHIIPSYYYNGFCREVNRKRAT